MAKKLIKEYIFNPGLGLNDNARPNAVSMIEQNLIFLIKESSAFIQNKITEGTDPNYIGLNFNQAKFEIDTENVLDALVFDLRYNGNEDTRRVSSLYWNEDVPQISGNRVPELEAYEYLKSLINTYILTDTLIENPQQVFATQILTELSPEEGTAVRVSSLFNSLTDVIEFGLDSLPPLTVGLGRIEILGKIELEEILIITNVTNNTVIYNFADTQKGGTVRFTVGNTEGYPQALSVDNGTTIINFVTDTSSMSTADNVQLFLEKLEAKMRLNDIALDAMERIKVGIPQAMLDADFEYGLQPTKWQAISTIRGYPSTYEIPASEIPVVTVTTDASVNSGGIGASLITVTTSVNHNLEIGSPITIRALSTSTSGFNRAEGTFLVQSTPTTTTFTYYAKSRVGTADGELIATANTQLRKADFYTGADSPEAIISVLSNGGTGSFDTTLQSPTGATNLTFATTGTLPEVGAPLTGTGIAAGTQISGVFGTATANGIQTSVFVEGNAEAGQTNIFVVDTAGITAGMIISNQDTPEQQLVITNIEGSALTLNGSLAASLAGDVQSYTIALSDENYIQGIGTGASFNVDATDFDGSPTYTSVTVNSPGSNYEVGDTLLILGSQLGGTDGVNDIYLNVETVNVTGVATVSIISSNSATAIASYTDVASSEAINPFLQNALVTVTRTAGGYISTSVNNGGNGFQNGNRFNITGTELSGLAPENNAVVVASDISFGVLQNFTVSGTSVRGDQIDIYAGLSISEPTTATISTGTTITSAAIATLNIEFATNHGLVPGATILTSVVSDNGTNNHNLAAGPFYIQAVTDSLNVTFQARSQGTIDDTTDPISGNVYIRPDSFFTHRPYDGGVQLGTGGPQHGAQAIRQSKKYIRYQSGKGTMYNTGALFAPSFDIQSITAAGTDPGSLITIVTDDEDHGLQAGSKIAINGVKTVGYDGEYTVTSIINERTCTVTATTPLGATTAVIGEQCQLALKEWHGAVVRSGCFDDQNGIFWQYDGQQLAVVRRSATFALAGTIDIKSDSNTITGTNSRFLDQVKEGDRIVIKGMTHVVTSVTNNTTMSVTPKFRGVASVRGTKAAKVVDTVIPQSEWNLDRCDGTGPSGYNIDVSKMQMIGIQFTWYGAGFIDWLLRGPDGNYIFCHRLKGNNLNTEAYMRSGNLPVRYEVTNEGPGARLARPVNGTQTTIPLDNASLFPNTGTVFVDNEIMNYTGKTGNTLTGVSRSATLSNFAGGSTRSYTAGLATSHNENQGVVLISCTTSPIISHWGSAYLIDGEFDEDRGYIFNYAETGLEIDLVKKTAFMIRLAPSVSNAITGDLGERELLNRAQLLLSSIEVTSDGEDVSNNTIKGGIVVEGVLNPSNYPVSPSDVQWQGLTSLAQGGQPSFAQVASSGAINWGTPTLLTETPTVQGEVSATFNLILGDGPNDIFSFETFDNVVGGDLGSRYAQNNDEDVYITQADFESSGIEVGDKVSHPSFPAKTVVQSITQNRRGVAICRLRLSEDATGNDTTNSTITITKANSSNSYTRPTILFTKASWETAAAGGVSLGTSVASTDTNWPAGTVISTVSTLQSLGTTEYYKIALNNSPSTAVAAAGTVTFDVSAPIYAQPGETVFSLIAQPGELASLMLESLKELTTTTLGGRGTFPNGPDVLAINVYKVAGAATNVNIMLRWGEAQA